MENIWAPWRDKFIYIRKHKKCIFCIENSARQDKLNLILERSEYSFSMMNKFPYNNGHLMVAPYRHVRELYALKDAEITDIMKLTAKTTKILKNCLMPHGFNIGINIGKVSGAGFPGHIHIHIVPRWQGDTNFMPVTGGTKVISESIEKLYGRLKNDIERETRTI